MQSQISKIGMMMVITMIITMLPSVGDAQSLFGGSNRGYNNYASRFEIEMMIARVTMIVISVGLGFALGWFFSPHARDLRRVILLGTAGLGIAVAVFNNGALGWSVAWLVSVIGFCGAFGYWVGNAVRALAEVPTTHGSSNWADSDEIAENNLFGVNGIRLGSYNNGQYEEAISYKGDRHLITSAPSRSGKGTTQIVPNLLSYEGSVLVIDPKGENSMITAQARMDMGQDVHIYDPWGIATGDGIEASCINPMDWLVAGDVDIAENAMMLTEAFVKKEASSDVFFDEEAKGLLQGYMLHVATAEEEAGQRHLPRVRDLLLLDGDDMKILHHRMLESPHHLVASTGARCLQKEERLMANVLASAQSHTHFLDSARVRESLSRSDFRFEDLKSKPMSIYFVLPADRIETFSRLLRILVQQAITVNARNIEQKPKKPVLFILDEMASLGRLSSVVQAYGLMAGFGMMLWGIVQNLSQCKNIYGDDWETLIANSGVVQYFGSTDKMSADYFSSLCGVTTVWNFSSAFSTAIGTSSGNSSSSSKTNTDTDTRAASQRQLAYPDELRRMRKDQQLLIVESMNPIMAKRVPWFEDEKLRSKGRDIHTQ